jgi:non-ribosomal peptide synthetase component E (peptide arylation enzyme)
MLPIFSAPLRDEGNASEESRPWIDGLTIGQVLAEAARRFPHRDAIVFPQAAVRMTYAEFATAVADAAKGLIALAVKPGEHVGIWATNIPEWVLLQYAALSIGVVLVTILHTGFGTFLHDRTKRHRCTASYGSVQNGLITTRFLRRSAPRSLLRRADL